MEIRHLIGRVLAIFAIAGLVAAPLVSPVAAMGRSNVAMSDMASMVDEMPCCPDTQKKNDCRDCPLLAICTLKNLATHPVADAVVERPAKHYQPAVPDDLMSEGLDRPPPDHPPRTLV
jgi:hypothetical protein